MGRRTAEGGEKTLERSVRLCVSCNCNNNNNDSSVYVCVCVVVHWHCSAQLSMFNMEKRYRNKIIIIIIIIINDNNDMKEAIQDFFTMSSLCFELSPRCMIKWPGYSHVQIMCNTSGDCHVQHVVCHVVQRGS